MKLLTVTVGPPAPPVVPPAWVAQPMIPPGGGGGGGGDGLLVGEVEGDGDGEVEGEGPGGEVVGLGPATSLTRTSSKEPAVKLANRAARPVENEPSEVDTSRVPLTEPASELPVALNDSAYHVPVAVENAAEASTVVAPSRICTEPGVSTSA